MMNQFGRNPFGGKNGRRDIHKRISCFVSTDILIGQHQKSETIACQKRNAKEKKKEMSFALQNRNTRLGTTHRTVTEHPRKVRGCFSRQRFCKSRSEHVRYAPYFSVRWGDEPETRATCEFSGTSNPQFKELKICPLGEGILNSCWNFPRICRVLWARPKEEPLVGEASNE